MCEFEETINSRVFREIHEAFSDPEQVGMLTVNTAPARGLALDYAEHRKAQIDERVTGDWERWSDNGQDAQAWENALDAARQLENWDLLKGEILRDAESKVADGENSKEQFSFGVELMYLAASLPTA